MKSVRIERINSEIQKAISHIIDNDIRDPQIDAIISVSSVETTPDLSYCRVYITSIGNTPSDEVLARIKGAAGFIRGRLSKMIRLRITPRLEFLKDESVEYSSKIENILKNITYSTEADSDDEE
ncbi:MAG: 30S ribosome-binding factor RbfA [Clostridiales bacterium]|nr:30S ribosome-binding factor RbfA [Clostridiales bacterium]